MSGASKSLVYTREQQFIPQATTLKSRVVLAGNYDPSKIATIENKMQRVFNADDVGTRYGLGSMLHRMAIYFEKSSNKEVEFYAFPLTTPVGGVAEKMTITFATNASSSGSWYFRIGSYLDSDLLILTVANGDTPTDQAAALSAAINAKGTLPFTAEPVAGVVTITAKDKGVSSGLYNVTKNIGQDESTLVPTGTTVVIAETVVGAGSSDLTDLWSELASEAGVWVTDLVTPYDSEIALNGASTTCGNPNEKTGLYGAPVYKPFNNYTCGTVGEAAGLADAIALGEDRKEFDACNVRLEAPDYPEVGFEISAYAVGAIAKSAQTNASKAYTSLSLPLLFKAQDSSKDWTNNAANRDSAVDAGITPIASLTGVSKFFDVSTFWHPVTSEINAPFKFVVNQRKIWNVANSIKAYESSASIQDRATVASVAATDINVNAIDTDTVEADLRVLANQWATKAWIYTDTFTIVNLSVTEDSENPDKYNIFVPIIISGNLRQKEADVAVSRNIAAVNVVIGG